MTEHIEQVYQALLADCTRDDTRKTLMVLKETLDEQVKRGSTVFQLPTLADLMIEKGSKGLSALKNTTGKRYRTLIGEYKKQYEKPLTVKKASSIDDWIDRIEQPDIKYLVKDMRAELRRLRGENDTLRNVKELDVDMRPQAAETPMLGANSDNASPVRAMTQIPVILTSQRETATELLDEGYLKKHNLRYDDKGALWYESGKYPVPISGRQLRNIFESLLTVNVGAE